MTASRAFALPWGNPDLDIHPNPVEGWHRVAGQGRRMRCGLRSRCSRGRS